MAQRLKEITYLRAFAALSIVLIHATSGYLSNGFWAVAINQFPRYGSPIFVTMSGFILYHIELKRPAPSYMHFFRHRFLKLAIPYSIWTFIYTSYSMGKEFSAANQYDVLLYGKTLLLNLITGTGYVHLYFILIMIQLYAFFPFLIKWIRHRPLVTLSIAALISFSFQTLIYLHRLTIITLPSLGIPYATLFPGWLIFFCFGIYLKIHLEQTMAFWEKRKLACFSIWLLLLAASIWEGWVSPVNLTLRPTITLYGITSFFLFYLLFNSLKNKVTAKTDQLLEWLANNSLQIYLVHPLILNFLVMPYSWGGFWGMVGLYINGVVFTCLLIYVLNITKSFLKKVAGEPKKAASNA